MGKVQFQVDGLDSNTVSIFNADATFDGNVDANSISIAGNPIGNVYATQSYVANALSNVTIDLSTAAGQGIDWNASTSAYDIDTTLVQTRVSGVSDTEIGYLDGVTSPIQTQIDSKAPLASPTLTGIISVQSILENATVGSVVIDTAQFDYDLLSCGSIYYITANPTSNWVLNIRGNSSTTLNSLMSVNKSLTIAFAVTNGATAKYMTGIKIDGVSVTPKWQGGTAITSGNASAIDVYSITIIKTADNTYTALASQSKFA